MSPAGTADALADLDASVPAAEVERRPLRVVPTSRGYMQLPEGVAQDRRHHARTDRRTTPYCYGDCGCQGGKRIDMCRQVQKCMGCDPERVDFRLNGGQRAFNAGFKAGMTWTAPRAEETPTP